MEFDGENKYIRITDIDEQSHKFIQSGLTSPNTDLSNANDYLLKEGDILFARTGASVGKSYQYDPLDGKVYYAGFLIRARIKPEFDSSFIFQNTLTEKYNNFIKITSQRSGQPGVNAQEYANFSIMVPSRGEQVKLGNFFKQLDNAIDLHQRKLEKTKALKSAYLSELFPVEGERKPKRRFAGFIDDWKQGTVGEYGYFYYGKSAPKWSVTKDAIIPCVRYGELYTKFGAKIDKVYSYTNISKENLKFSTGNEVLVPRVGEDPLDFANCSWLSIPNVAIGEMISVYNTEENPLFISYYFNSQLRHAFAKRVEGGNVSNLYFTYLENITISIPNKEEQDTIANFLESLDSVVEHHQHKLEKLKNIKQAYLNELFV